MLLAQAAPFLPLFLVSFLFGQYAYAELIASENTAPAAPASEWDNKFRNGLQQLIAALAQRPKNNVTIQEPAVAPPKATATSPQGEKLPLPVASEGYAKPWRFNPSYGQPPDEAEESRQPSPSFPTEKSSWVKRATNRVLELTGLARGKADANAERNDGHDTDAGGEERKIAPQYEMLTEVPDDVLHTRPALDGGYALDAAGREAFRGSKRMTSSAPRATGDSALQTPKESHPSEWYQEDGRRASNMGPADKEFMLGAARSSQDATMPEAEGQFYREKRVSDATLGGHFSGSLSESGNGISNRRSDREEDVSGTMTRSRPLRRSRVFERASDREGSVLEASQSEVPARWPRMSHNVEAWLESTEPSTRFVQREDIYRPYDESPVFESRPVRESGVFEVMGHDRAAPRPPVFEIGATDEHAMIGAPHSGQTKMLSRRERVHTADEGYSVSSGGRVHKMRPDHESRVFAVSSGQQGYVSKHDPQTRRRKDVFEAWSGDEHAMLGASQNSQRGKLLQKWRSDGDDVQRFDVTTPNRGVSGNEKKPIPEMLRGYNDGFAEPDFQPQWATVWSDSRSGARRAPGVGERVKSLQRGWNAVIPSGSKGHFSKNAQSNHLQERIRQDQNPISSIRRKRESGAFGMSQKGRSPAGLRTSDTRDPDERSMIGVLQKSGRLSQREGVHTSEQRYFVPSEKLPQRFPSRAGDAVLELVAEGEEEEESPVFEMEPQRENAEESRVFEAEPEREDAEESRVFEAEPEREDAAESRVFEMEPEREDSEESRVFEVEPKRENAEESPVFEAKPEREDAEESRVFEVERERADEEESRVFEVAPGRDNDLSQQEGRTRRRKDVFEVLSGDEHARLGASHGSQREKLYGERSPHANHQQPVGVTQQAPDSWRHRRSNEHSVSNMAYGYHDRFFGRNSRGASQNRRPGESSWRKWNLHAPSGMTIDEVSSGDQLHSKPRMDESAVFEARYDRERL